MGTIHSRPAATRAAAVDATINWTAGLDGQARPTHAGNIESDGTVADATRHRFGVPGSKCGDGETFDAAHVRKPYADVWASSAGASCYELTAVRASSTNDAAIPKR